MFYRFTRTLNFNLLVLYIAFTIRLYLLVRRVIIFYLYTNHYRKIKTIIQNVCPLIKIFSCCLKHHTCKVNSFNSYKPKIRKVLIYYCWKIPQILRAFCTRKLLIQNSCWQSRSSFHILYHLVIHSFIRSF